MEKIPKDRLEDKLEDNDELEPGKYLQDWETEQIPELEIEADYWEGQELVCEIIAPNGEVLDITNNDYKRYKRGTIRKFVKEHRHD